MMEITIAVVACLYLQRTGHPLLMWVPAAEVLLIEVKAILEWLVSLLEDGGRR